MTIFRKTNTHRRLALVSVLRKIAKTPQRNYLLYSNTLSIDTRPPATGGSSTKDTTTFDLTGLPTLACICGSLMFNITVMWDKDSRSVGWYDLRQQCHSCGAVSTAPTEIDGCD